MEPLSICSNTDNKRRQIQSQSTSSETAARHDKLLQELQGCIQCCRTHNVTLHRRSRELQMKGDYELTKAGYHVVFFFSPVATPSTQTTLPNRSSFCRLLLSSSSLDDEDNSSSWLWERYGRFYSECH
ncbi:hypothetical protein EYF80_027116 [Liparis tanakae]|uniref:Uncharacterized protein n=1 Tax=Liparis tanakae TaxID=230148 RepID=A0A4Z2HBN0_9TELE|nr:hypothetical protein EYF80_027116 [Liparis tanakae]